MAHAFSKTCQQRTVGNAKLIGQHIEHMCLAIFIAADYPLPITPKEQHLNQMRVSELVPDQESMRKRFSKPYIDEVTANGDGCACAFQYEPDWEGEPLIAEKMRGPALAFHNCRLTWRRLTLPDSWSRMRVTAMSWTVRQPTMEQSHLNS